MNKIEILGIISSVTVLVSMIIRSDTVKGNIIFRFINTVGSIGFIIYGLNINAYSTAFLNACAVILNIIYIIKLLKSC